MKPVAGHGVAVAHVEQVVDVPVEVRDALPVELGLHRRAVDVVDPVHRLVGDLVVDRIGVRREEVGRPAHLVRVDEQRARVLAQELDLAVGLGLGASEPVAVHVEPVEVAAGVRLAAVRVLDRQEHDDRVVEDLPGRAVVAVGELVEHAHGCVGARLLAAVDVGGDPEDGGIATGDLSRLSCRGARVTQRLGRALDVAQRTAAELIRLTHDGPAQLASLLRGLIERAGDDTLARRVHRVHVGVRLIGGHLAVLASGRGHDLGERRHLAAELGRRLRRVAGGLGRGGSGGERRDRHSGQDDEAQTGQGFSPRRD